MKNRTSLLLMEQLVMVLVFALAAALCLGIFVEADRVSWETAHRDEAVLIAQNAAEILKATAGDAAYAVQMLEPDAAKDGYRLEIELADTGSPYLSRAEIRVYLDDAEFFALSTGWQEGVP